MTPMASPAYQTRLPPHLLAACSQRFPASRCLHPWIRLPAFLLGCAVFICTAQFSAGADDGAPIIFTARDLAGKTPLAAEKNAPATVWLFLAHDCPICNGYSPEIARIV